jgi:hypothetical protein
MHHAAKMRQGGFHQRIERATAVRAAVAGYPARPTPARHMAALAVRATNAVQPPLPKFGHQICSNAHRWPCSPRR